MVRLLRRGRYRASCRRLVGVVRKCGGRVHELWRIVRESLIDEVEKLHQCGHGLGGMVPGQIYTEISAVQGLEVGHVFWRGDGQLVAAGGGQDGLVGSGRWADRGASMDEGY